MPISVDEIENGDAPRAETPGQVVTFLASHADLAYTPAEIAGALGLDRETVVTASTELAERDLVRRVGDYWTVVDDERVRG